MILARLASPTDVGVYSLGLALSAPVFMFANLQLRELLATDPSARSFSDYLVARLLTTIMSMVVVAAGAILVYEWRTAQPILLVTASKSFEAVSDIVHGQFQRRGRQDLWARSVASRGITGLVGFSGGLLLIGGNLEAALTGQALAWGGCLFLDRRWLSNLTPTYGFEPPRTFRGSVESVYLIVGALPLGFASLIGSLNTAFPRVLVEQEHGPAALGILAAIAHFPLIGARTVTASNRATSADLTSALARADYVNFRRAVVRSGFLACTIAVVGTAVAELFGEPILTAIYGSDYAQLTSILVLLMVAACADYVGLVTSLALTALRHLRLQVACEVVAFLFTAATAWLTIKDFGLLGAALSSIVGAAVRLLLHVLTLSLAAPPLDSSCAAQQ